MGAACSVPTSTITVTATATATATTVTLPASTVTVTPTASTLTVTPTASTVTSTVVPSCSIASTTSSSSATISSLTTTISSSSTVSSSTTSSALPVDTRIAVAGINSTADAASYKPICHDASGVHILAGSGAQQPMYNAYGLLSFTVDNIISAFPGTTNFSIPFNKTNTPPYAAPANAAGVVAMRANIDWYSQGCPKTPIVLLGYSAGGIVTMNSICGRSVNAQAQDVPLDPKYNANIMSIIVYGEESYIPNTTYNKGTCVGGQGTLPRFNTTPCAPYAAKIASYCDTYDGGCCNGTPPALPAVHLYYPTQYQNQTIDVLRSAYATFK